MKTKTLILSSVAALTVSTVALAGHFGGNHFAKLDTNADGQVTPAEFQSAAAERIAAADSDGDGAVTPDEMKQHMKSKHAEHKAAFVAKLDANGDGELSRDEVSRMPEEKFTELDTDGNGTLSVEEFSAAGPKHHDKHGKRGPGKMLEMTDTNNDGKVDVQEAQAMADQFFSKLDRNSDGVLTSDEMKHPGKRGNHGKRGKKQPAE